MSGPSHEEGLAGALHEVSNALTVVLGWLQMAQRESLTADAQKALTIAEEHARRGHLIARRAIGAEPPSEPSSPVGTSRPRSAAEIARFTLESLAPQAAERNVELKLTTAPNTEAELLGGPSLIQVLTNLLLNAIAFTPSGSTVSLQVAPAAPQYPEAPLAATSPQSLTFRVSDQGPGVPLARRERLFTHPESTRAGGAGIGLPHSRALARGYGGDLQLLPSELGALFELSWPCSQAAERPASRPAPRSNLLGARILLIDDDDALCTLVELGLEARGAEVLVAQNQEQLQRLLASRPLVDAALVDLSPLENNLEAQLAELTSALPSSCAVLLVSGQPSGIPPEGEGLFCDWVRKPFAVDELVAAISRHLPASES